jgi:DHA3 family macrolide efflux protein-like MFS transporter
MLMILGNLGSAFCMMLVLFVVTQSTNLSLVYVGVMLSSVFFALQNPAYKASVSDLLPPSLYAKASGLIQLSNSAQFVFAPLLGGFLLTIVGIQGVLCIDILTFIVSAALMIFTKVIFKITWSKIVQDTSLHYYQDLADSLSLLLSHRGILTLVSLISLLLFYIGLIQTLLTPMVLAFADVKTLGIGQSVCAVGMLLTSLMIGGATRKMRNSLILTTALLFMGISFAFIGITDNIWAVIIPGFLFFAAIPYANSSIDVLIRQNIPNIHQGRIWSLISTLTYIGALVAYAVSGFFADKIFNPWFMPEGRLAGTLGHIFGVGPGRGIACIFFVSGFFVVCLSVLVYRSKSIRQLDEIVPQHMVDLVYE